MTQTVSGAVAVRQRQDQVVAWIRAQQDDIAMIAASHVKPSAIVRVTQGALRRNDKLMAAAIANPQSLLYALLDAARLGHEPDTDDYYLVPFGNEVTGIEGYKGIIERMYRAGGVETVVAEVVRQTDVYRPCGSTTPPLHEYDDFASPAERGPLRGAYAYALWPDGRCSQVIRMGRAEIMEHKAKSRGSHKPDSPWHLWEPAMWKKTVLRALEPYVPTSTEYRRAPVQGPVREALRAEHQAHEAARPPVPPADVVDAEIVDEPAAAEDPTPAPGAPATAPTAHPAPAAGGAANASQTATGRRGTSSPSAPSAAAAERLQNLIRQLPLGPDEDVATLLAWITGKPDVLEAELTAADVKTVTTTLDDALKHANGDPAEAASQLWGQYRKATGQGDG